MIVSRLAIVASLAVVAATAGCGPRLREGTKAGSKYELARTEVKDMGNGVRLYTHHGWWFTRGGSGRRLTFYDLQNVAGEDLCVSFIVSVPGDEYNIGIWFPVTDVVLKRGKTRTQIGGFASGRDDDFEIGADVSTITLSARPDCGAE